MTNSSFKMNEVQEENIVHQSNAFPRNVVGMIVVCFLFAILSLAFFSSQPSNVEEHQSDVVYLNDKNFEEQTASGIVLVDFSMDGCGPCIMMEPTLEKIATQFKDKAIVANVNGPYSPRTANKFWVQAYPTLVLLKDGHEIDRKMGLQSESQLIGLIETAFSIAGKSPEPPGAEEHQSDVVHLDDKNFEVQTASGVVLVDFYADWCGPCQMMAPDIEKVATQFKGKAIVAKVNGDYNRRTEDAFQVMVYPTLVLLKDGQEIVRKSGLQSESQLIALIETAF